MSKKLNRTNGVWATEIKQPAATFWDYFLWKEIDGSDTIIGHIGRYAEDDWELEARGESYKGSSLQQIIDLYLKEQEG
jgi:hypothetical protein